MLCLSASVAWEHSIQTHKSNRDPLMDGVFSTPEGMYHIKSIASYKIAKRDRDIDIASPLSRHASYINSKHILIKEADMYLGQLPEEKQVDHGLDKREALEASAGGCGFKLADQVGLGDYFETLKMQKREEEKGRLFARAPAGCPSSRKTLVMAAAADCAFVNAKGGSVNALNAILANWNAASKIFESTFNIALALVKVQIEQQCTPNEDLKKWNQDCSSDYTISNRLSDFSRWRGAFKDDGIGLWHLMTRCGTQPSVGIAWLGKLCSTTSESQRAG